jgi:hypothetical protein
MNKAKESVVVPKIASPIPDNAPAQAMNYIKETVAADNSFAGKLVKRSIRDIKFLKTEDYFL